MNQQVKIDAPSAETKNARDWMVVLAKYREPKLWRSIFELCITVAPFIALWALAFWASSFSWPLALLISALNGGFLLRLFAIQHDCGHGSFFKNRQVSDWVGRFLGVFTVTPYDVWRRSHAIHHSHSGNLGRRGMGEIATITVDEYAALSRLRKFQYRLYRHPITLFVLGPAYIFLVQNRLPVGFMKSGWTYWVSAMTTNFGIVAILGVAWYFGGLAAVLFAFLPSTLVAATIGVWLFYVQHQFETTHWDQDEDWSLHEAALHGSSHYDLPIILRWFTANIGIHHVHHLYSRIPFYRLSEVLRDHKELIEVSRMTLLESFRCANLDLWDEKNRRLVSFATVRAS